MQFSYSKWYAENGHLTGVDISADGGSTWTTLKVLEQSNVSSSDRQRVVLPITPYISANTAVRFWIENPLSATVDHPRFLFTIDYVDIQYTTSVGNSTIDFRQTQTIRDEFNGGDIYGEDGTTTWLEPWEVSLYRLWINQNGRCAEGKCIRMGYGTYVENPYIRARRRACRRGCTASPGTGGRPR